MEAQGSAEELPLDSLEIPSNASLQLSDGTHVDATELQIRLNWNFAIEIEFQVPQDSFNAVWSQNDPLLLDLKGQLIPIFTISMKHFSDSGLNIKAVPKRERLPLHENSSEAHEVSAIILNGPEMWLGENGLQFERDEYLLHLENRIDPSESRRRGSSQLITRFANQRVTVRHRDNKAFSLPDAEKALHHFARFLTFVRGGRCGLGHIFGVNNGGKDEFACIGFSSTDQIDLPHNWHQRFAQIPLPEVYSKYTRLVGNPKDRRPALRAIEFYRSASVIRQSSTIEIAIVSSQTALEILVEHILRGYAGWTASLSNQRGIKIADKIRATAAFVGLTVDPLHNLPRLQQKRQKSKKDAFDLLTETRNSIVHPRQQDNCQDGLELVETYHLSQWLCEILIFFLMGYAGKMRDQRMYSGFEREAICDVPLKQQ